MSDYILLLVFYLLLYCSAIDVTHLILIAFFRCLLDSTFCTFLTVGGCLGGAVVRASDF